MMMMSRYIFSEEERGENKNEMNEEEDDYPLSQKARDVGGGLKCFAPFRHWQRWLAVKMKQLDTVLERISGRRNDMSATTRNFNNFLPPFWVECQLFLYQTIALEAFYTFAFEYETIRPIA